MTSLKETVYTKNLDNKQITVERAFDAPLDLVWRAWTEKELLDQWWAPKPWQAKTISMDFTVGGAWFYMMQGPQGESAYTRAVFTGIENQKSFSADDVFCDEAGNTITDFPAVSWINEFSSTTTGTKVEVQLSFASVEDLEKLVQMGFEEGFASGHRNLDELLQQLQ